MHVSDESGSFVEYIPQINKEKKYSLVSLLLCQRAQMEWNVHSIPVSRSAQFDNGGIYFNITGN